MQYKLLPLPFGILAGHDIVHLAALSPGGAPHNRTLFHVLEQDPGSPFAVRAERGRGVISTLRPLHAPGLYHLKVQAQAMGEQQVHSVFIILISVSPYPY